MLRVDDLFEEELLVPYYLYCVIEVFMIERHLYFKIFAMRLIKTNLKSFD